MGERGGGWGRSIPPLVRAVLLLALGTAEVTCNHQHSPKTFSYLPYTEHERASNVGYPLPAQQPESLLAQNSQGAVADNTAWSQHTEQNGNTWSHHSGQNGGSDNSGLGDNTWSLQRGQSSRSDNIARSQHGGLGKGPGPNGRPLFTRITVDRNVTAQAGEVVFLPCTMPAEMEDEEKVQVTWVRRSDWHILALGAVTYTRDPRFAVHHSKGSGEWTLAIKYVRGQDSGTYECQMLSPHSTATLLVGLRVFTPQASIAGEEAYYADVGSTISLDCFITQIAIPPPFVFWYHDNRSIDYDTDRGGIKVSLTTAPRVLSHLEITNARLTDSGNYTCTAANTESASVTVHITQANRVAAVQPRAVGSKGWVNPPPPCLLLLPLAVLGALVPLKKGAFGDVTTPSRLTSQPTVTSQPLDDVTTPTRLTSQPTKTKAA